MPYLPLDVVKYILTFEKRFIILHGRLLDLTPIIRLHSLFHKTDTCTQVALKINKSKRYILSYYVFLEVFEETKTVYKFNEETKRHEKISHWLWQRN